MFNADAFYKLVKDNGGFEIALGFRGDVDHFIGGTGNKIWYFVQKRSGEDFYVCTEENGRFTDVHFVRKKKVLKSAPAEEGRTMELILSELAAGQEEIEKDGRKPAATEYCGHPCSHYSFAFGERAYKILDEYGVTAEYSNLNDEEAGFRIRNVHVGEDVKAPKEN